jgi:hypothetical protein
MIDLGMLYEISWLWIELDSGNMEQQYLEGTLVAEVYDTKKKNLVWIAVGTSRNFNKDSKKRVLSSDLNYYILYNKHYLVRALAENNFSIRNIRRSQN